MGLQQAASSSSSETSDLREDEGWEDAEPDNEELSFVSFFDDAVFQDAISMLEYTKEKYQFDFVSTQKEHGLDFLSSIKLVNYIRQQTKDGNTKLDIKSAAEFNDDKYLQPVLEDDALLFSLDDISPSTQQGDNILATSEAADANPSPEAKIAHLERQLQNVQSQYKEYRHQVEETLEKRWTDESTGNSSTSADAQSGKPDYDGNYFDSYSYNDIHETMLKDTVRTDAYRDFIYESKHLFAGKTVLDVGCGTGILSMFCARAGAAKVIAVDNSNIIDKARTNIHANGLSDVITCLRGKIEEVNLPLQKVDIIVSEWMGYCLLFEAMLDSVLWARDRYLAPDGLMVPSHCVLQVAPIEDQDYLVENVDFWRDVYGFNMTAMMEKIYDDILVRHLPSKNLAARSAPFLTLPLHTITTPDLSFVKSFSVELSRDIDALDGWVIWFDTFFLTSRDAVLPEDARAESWSSSGKNGVAFTTGPAGKETHWRSGVMLIDRSKKAGEPLKAGTKIQGSVEYKKGKENVRNLEIELKWGSDSQLWFMH
ncbi:hypothetical protein BLS_002660 [Venturia inaequalis]|uniref:type I protein arginine methyltransferase n=1 Tax=Venturia inaequalis TaxID=5025 RepID=A0A8H3Z7K2_VENIN|nr:hypothetical protein BLS_002660 [Venturia inaequalis]KAE9983427.1 hypothetical protein EG327_005470 [Venturia inaequalis]KAE9989087.1 hypothetical protein EG328_000018 [Venturia inaequalis]